MARTTTYAAALAVASTAAAAAGWQVAHRRDLARLAADPHRDILTAVPPGRPTSVATSDGGRLAVRVNDAVADPVGAIVLSHGWGMGIRFWMHQMRALAPDHLVVAYAQRGHCASSEVGADGFTIGALGRDLAEVVEAHVPPDLPLVTVGHSLGGMSVLASGRVPGMLDRVDGAVLIDTGANDLVRGMFRGLGVIEHLAGAVGARALRARLPIPKRTTPVSSRLVRAVALNPRAAPSAVALTEQLFLDCPVDSRAGVGGALADLDLSGDVSRWKAPTTVVVGTGDRMTPGHHARRLVELLPDGELIEIHGAGHQSPLENPEAVTSAILDRTRRATA